MIYLDYAADTPADPIVVHAFSETALAYGSNPNSVHKLGTMARERLIEGSRKIAEFLGVKDTEIIYTSGATEANNLAIKGIAGEYKSKGRHLITTYLEHSSVTGPFTALEQLGYEVDYVDILENGQIDTEHLEELLREDTILVSVCYVDSEIGGCQPISEIGELLQKFPNCAFHVDATQAVGKIPISTKNIDLMTFSPHKFYGICGFGALIKKEHLRLETQIHGGISTSPYRSGTPVITGVAAMEKAMELVFRNLEENYDYVKELNEIVRKELSGYKKIRINSNEKGSPYILNISIAGYKTEEFQRKLEEFEIYVSTKSACCAVNTPSRPVYAVTKDRKAALSTLRISFSHKTEKSEIAEFLSVFKKCYEALCTA